MVLETFNLTKHYGTKVGCSNVSINVNKGETFGFLGPNGAGKSTFIKMMTGLLFPTSGSANILGKPLGHIDTRKKIGYLPENFKYQDWMTGVDLLSFHASLYKLDKNTAKRRLNEVLELVHLKGSEKYKIGTYSKGMQQRIGLASALLTDPDLLFLDEPTSALDPIGRKEVRDIMQDLKDRGKTVLLNSHLLSEVEMVCDSVAIINKGSIITQGKMSDMLSNKLVLHIDAGNLNEHVLSKLKDIDPQLQYMNIVLKNTDISSISDSGTRLQHEVTQIKMAIKNNDFIPDIARLIIDNGGYLYKLSPHGQNLESLFISMVESEEK